MVDTSANAMSVASRACREAATSTLHLHRAEEAPGSIPYPKILYETALRKALSSVFSKYDNISCARCIVLGDSRAGMIAQMACRLAHGMKKAVCIAILPQTPERSAALQEVMGVESGKRKAAGGDTQPSHARRRTASDGTGTDVYSNENGDAWQDGDVVADDMFELPPGSEVVVMSACALGPNTAAEALPSALSAWYGACHLVLSDVSGVFGDDKFFPEMIPLASNLFLLQSGGHVIPSSYSSFVAPVYCPQLHNDVVSKRDSTESAFVCSLPKNAIILHDPVEVYCGDQEAFVDRLRGGAMFSIDIGIAERKVKFLRDNMKGPVGSPPSNRPFTPSPQKRVRGAPTFAFDTRVMPEVIVHGFVGFFRSVLFDGVYVDSRPSSPDRNVFHDLCMFFTLSVPQSLLDVCLMGDKLSVVSSSSSSEEPSSSEEESDESEESEESAAENTKPTAPSAPAPLPERTPAPPLIPAPPDSRTRVDAWVDGAANTPSAPTQSQPRRPLLPGEESSSCSSTSSSSTSTTHEREVEEINEAARRGESICAGQKRARPPTPESLVEIGFRVERFSRRWFSDDEAKPLPGHRVWYEWGVTTETGQELLYHNFQGRSQSLAIRSPSAK